MSAAAWPAWVEDGVAFRRELHRHPELTWQEHDTAARIRARLDALGIAWRACAGTGTLATLAPRASGSHIALRADIDALPIEERTGLPWASTRPGCMHACGHDGHSATLLTAARWIKAHEPALPGPVTLLFQPAEEGGHGAKRMIEEGALEGVDRIFGWHNWPSLPLGTARCPDGAVMAGNGQIDLEVIGVGGHGSQPELTRDPILAGASIVVALQQIVSRRFSPQDAVVVAITGFDAPSAPTVVRERASLVGSYRITQPEQAARVAELVEAIATRTAEAHGVRCEVRVEPRYPPTVNEPSAAQAMRALLADELGAAGVAGGGAPPIMASEDFSYYLHEVPGAYALVGAGDGSEGEAGRGAPPCHNPSYDFNDALLPRMARVYARLAGAPAPPV